MKCQILFSRKNKKNISKYCLLKFLLSMQSVKSTLELKYQRDATCNTIQLTNPNKTAF